MIKPENIQVAANWWIDLIRNPVLENYVIASSYRYACLYSKDITDEQVENFKSSFEKRVTDQLEITDCRLYTDYTPREILGEIVDDSGINFHIFPEHANMKIDRWGNISVSEYLGAPFKSVPILSKKIGSVSGAKN